jgi:peptidoglycan glycosyltransferase
MKQHAAVHTSVHRWRKPARFGMMADVVFLRAIALYVVACLVVACGLACAPPPPPPLPANLGAARAHGKSNLAIPQPPKLGAMTLDAEKHKYTAPYGWGNATLTLEPALQEPLENDLRLGRPQWGATVIFDIKTGAILALAQHSEREPGLPGQGVRPLAKAASVFKIVTAAALLRKGVSLSEQVCGTGGKTRLKPKLIFDDDDAGPLAGCIKFADVLPYSRNIAMAKLANKFLTPQLLRDEATRFYFDRALPVDFEVTPSQAPIPTDDEFLFANTAAGFGDVKLSALHGAVLAAIAGNGGVLVPPHLIASVDGEEAPARFDPVRVVDEDTAEALQAMMTATVDHGTAARAFTTTERGYHPFTTVAVAGKTGSLTDHRGRRGKGGLDYTWFVGTAPAHDPKIAVGVAMVNDEWDWYARALDIAKLMLKRYFNEHPEDARTGGVVAR